MAKERLIQNRMMFKFIIKKKHLFSSYPTYFTVGLFNTIFTIGLREIIEVYIDSEELLGYIISIVFAYTVGILVSFALHSYLTFAKSRKYSKKFLKRFVYFYGNQSLGMVLTIGLSLLIRETLELTQISTKFENTIAFSMAAILTSIVTYVINKLFIFNIK